MILISNDDGIHSEGLAALQAELSKSHDVVVVAPDRERSAVSRALTLNRPLRAEKIRDGFFSVDGTPTDCVNLAMNGLFRGRISMVISGINKGGNLGEDITYSGTVSAAMEGLLLGVPSIAVSCVAREGFIFETAARYAGAIAAEVIGNGIPADTLLNVNVPNHAPDAIKGIKITKMGKMKYGDAIVEKTDPRGKKYYWIGGMDLSHLHMPGSDIEAVRDGYVSITPIHLDLTNYGAMEKLRTMSFGNISI